MIILGSRPEKVENHFSTTYHYPVAELNYSFIPISPLATLINQNAIIALCSLSQWRSGRAASDVFASLICDLGG